MKLNLDSSQVRSVYSGKVGRCCCGCNGKHWYSLAHREESGKSRGYLVRDEEISDQQVKKIVNKIIRLVEGGATLDKVDGIYYSVDVGNKRYIAYFS